VVLSSGGRRHPVLDFHQGICKLLDVGFLILEMREGSGWNDSEKSYEFPRRYLAQFEQAMRDGSATAIIYEPRRQRGTVQDGRLAFVAWTVIAEPPRKIGGTNNFLVEFHGGLRSFDRPVPFKIDGVPVEHRLREIERRRWGSVLQGKSVRVIPEANAMEILMLGCASHARIRSYRLEASDLDWQERNRRIITRLDRDVRFRDGVLASYGFRCAISGLGIGPGPASRLFGVLDAAHIRPVALSGSDSPSNGIAMTPTLHRLFDAGLFTLRTTSRRVVVKRSPQLLESMLVGSKARISLEDGMEIAMPSDPRWAPSRESLRFHESKVFLNSA
jgi:putative restriction endonuclease